MKDYQIVMDYTSYGLEQMINGYLSEGYLLAGGCFTTGEHGDLRWFQAVYKLV